MERTSLANMPGVSGSFGSSRTNIPIAREPIPEVEPPSGLVPRLFNDVFIDAPDEGWKAVLRSPQKLASSAASATELFFDALSHANRVVNWAANSPESAIGKLRLRLQKKRKEDEPPPVTQESFFKEAQWHERFSTYAHNLSRWLQQAAETGIEARDPKIFAGDFLDNPSFSRIFANAAESSVPMLAALASLLIPGAGPGTAAGVLAGSEALPVYTELKEQGVEESDAALASLLSGYGTYLLEKVGIKAILGKNKWAKKLEEKIGKSFLVGGTFASLAEGLTEMPQGFWQTTVALMTPGSKEDMPTLKEWASRGLEEMFTGMFLGLGGAAAAQKIARITEKNFLQDMVNDDLFAKKEDPLALHHPSEKTGLRGPEEGPLGPPPTISAEVGLTPQPDSGGGSVSPSLDPFASEGPSKQGGRPDLSQIAEAKEVRDHVQMIDQLRNEAGLPERKVLETWKTNAKQALDQGGLNLHWKNFLANPGEYMLKVDKRTGALDATRIFMARRMIDLKGKQIIESGDPEAAADLGIAINMYRNQMTGIGQALFSGRDFMETPAERHRRMIYQEVFDLDPKASKAMSKEDFVEAAKLTQDNSKRIFDMLSFMKEQGYDLANLSEETLADKHAVAEILRQVYMQKASRAEKMYEFWRNGLLGAFGTPVLNVLTASGYGIYEYAYRQGLNAIGDQMRTKEEKIRFNDVQEAWKYAVPGINEGMKRMLTSWSTEQPLYGHERSKLEVRKTAIKGGLGRFIRWPGRAVMAGDEFLTGVFSEMELAFRASQMANAKELIGADREEFIQQTMRDPEPALKAAVEEKVDQLLFKGKPGKLLTWVMSSRHLGLPTDWGFRVMLPFLLTPGKILLEGTTNLPPGSLVKTGIKKLREKPISSQEAAEILLASGAAYFFWAATDDQDEDGNFKVPFLTGSYPVDEAKRRLWKSNRIMPNAIRLFGRQWGWARFDPFATALTMAIDATNMARQWKEGEPVTDIFARGFQTFKSLVRDKSFLQVVGDIIRATEDERNAPVFVERLVSSISPNWLRANVRATDPYIRDFKNRQKGLEGLKTMGKRIGQRMVPASFWMPMPKYDRFGRPFKKTEQFGPATDFLFRIFWPGWIQETPSLSNVERMVANWNQRAIPEDRWYFGDMPNNTYKIPGSNKIHRMPEPHYHWFVARAGTRLRENLREERFYFNFANPTAEDISEIKSLVEDSTKWARDEYVEKVLSNPNFRFPEPQHIESEFGEVLFTPEIY